MKQSLFKQVYSLIQNIVNGNGGVSTQILPSAGLNQNTIGTPTIIDTATSNTLRLLRDDINTIQTSLQGIPQRILSGMQVKASESSKQVTINAGSVYLKQGIFQLEEQSNYTINTSVIGTKYIVIDNGVLKTYDSVQEDLLLIAKIVINVANDVIEDNANKSYTNNYIVSGKDLAVIPEFEIDDDTKFIISNVMQELLASNLVGTIRLNEGLNITNQQDSVRLNSKGMEIYSDDDKYASFDRDGVVFFDSNGLMLSQYTKDGATIGNISILPDSIESTNFKSGNKGFQIKSDGNVEFNNITARGTIVARDGLIGGVTISNSGLYSGTGIFGNANTPFYLDKNGKLSLGDKLTWDGTTLNIVGGLSVDWIDVTDSTGKKPSDNADVTTTAIGAGVITTGKIELQNTSNVTGAGIRGGGTLGAEIRIWAGSTLASAATAPFRVTHDGALTASNANITGTITASSGTIAGWDIQAGLLRFVASTTANRIELNKTLNRVSVFDTVNEKVVMGYLDGLPKNDGTGNWGSGDYGFWARSGDKLSIDGDGEYINGDWIIQHDASYLVNDSSDKTIIRLGTGTGTDIGEKGLFIYNTSGTTLAKLVSDKIFIGEATKYLQYTTAGGLAVKGNITSTSGTIGGWTLGGTTLSGTNMTLTNTGNLSAGTGNDIVRISANDATYRLWAGNATAANAPFSVTKAGALKATSGTVGGITLATDKMYIGTGTYSSSDTAFYVDANGKMSLKDKLRWDGTNLTISGNIQADNIQENYYIVDHATYGTNLNAFFNATTIVYPAIIQFEDGAYTMTADIQISSASSISLVGIDGSVIDNTSYKLDFNSVDNININTLEFSGTATLIDIDTNSSNFNMDNCKLYSNFSSGAAVIIDTINNIMTNNYFENKNASPGGTCIRKNNLHSTFPNKITFDNNDIIDYNLAMYIEASGATIPNIYIYNSRISLLSASSVVVNLNTTSGATTNITIFQSEFSCDSFIKGVGNNTCNLKISNNNIQKLNAPMFYNLNIIGSISNNSIDVTNDTSIFKDDDGINVFYLTGDFSDNTITINSNTVSLLTAFDLINGNIRNNVCTDGYMGASTYTNTSGNAYLTDNIDCNL